jgi:OmpA-OmpF porin, OOP family
MRATTTLALAALLLAGGCKIKREPSAEASSAPSAAAAVAASSSAAPAPAGFSPQSVAESSASLPAFPLFKDLEGLTNNLNEKDANRAFNRDHFIAGETLVPVEGKVFHGEYNLTKDRPYSSIEFRRNYELAISQLGGARIGGPLNTDKYRRELIDANPAATGHCFLNTCDDADFYLIRQQGKEWWISVATGSFPLHGYVTVLEKQTMAKSFSFMDAGALKSALDANGRVPVYVEFDVDRASLRPSARPAVDEIIKLMQANPQLRVSIEGHTDDTGTAARNGPLSNARAMTVLAELLAAGIAPARMKTAGFGSSKPLVQGTSEEARAKNRRVELVKF